MKKKSNWLALLPFALFAALALLFFAPFILGKMSFIWDTRVFGFPNLHMVTSFLADGHVLAWNPYNFSGYPFMGDIETGLFYPINWLVAFLFGPLEFEQLGFYFAFHFFIGASFAFLLFKKLTGNVFAATAAAIVYAYSGYALGHISHMGQVLMYMWVPLVIWSYMIALEKRTWLSTLLAGASFGLAISVGHFNTSVYLLLGLSILCALALYKNKAWKQTALHALTATIFAFFTVGILFVPVYEFAQLSNRADLTYEQQSEDWSLHPENLLGQINANHNNILADDPLTEFNGSVDITQNYLYVGLLALVLALTGLFTRKKYKAFFLTFGALTLLAALGKYTPVNYALFHLFPGFNKARMAVQIMGMFFLCLAAFTAFGADYFMKLQKKKYATPIGLLIILVITLDIFSHGFNRNFYGEDYPPTEVYGNASDAEMIAMLEGEELFRISDEIQTLDSNKWELHGVENVWGNGGIKIASYDALFERLGPFSWRAKSDSYYDFLNVKYLFTDRELDPEQFAHIEGNLHENLQFLPRAYFVEQYTLIKTLEEIDFSQEVLLTEEPEYLGEAGHAGDGQIVVTRESPNHLVIDASLPSSGLLVLSEVDYPGWQLYVDGQKHNYLTANEAFRAVPLMPGEHTVEFKYRPLSYLFGALSTGLSMLLLAGLALYSRCNGKNSRHWWSRLYRFCFSR